MSITKLKVEQTEQGWTGRIYSNGVLVFTTEIYPTEEECREVAAQKLAEFSN
jgi:hypothetical protein